MMNRMFGRRASAACSAARGASKRAAKRIVRAGFMELVLG
jgi:hypothetical protein